MIRVMARTRTCFTRMTPLAAWRRCVLLSCLAPMLAIASGERALELREYAPGVFVHAGQHAALEDPARADSANLGIVVGERCVAVVDSGGAVATGEALLAAVRERIGKPVCYVINTHVHFDHVLGNAAFAGTDAEFAGHRRLGEALPANRSFFAEAFAAELGGPDQGEKVIGPSLLVDGRMELDLGNRLLVLEAHPKAHTDTDLTVLDVTTATLFAGDLLFRERMPVLDGSLLGWIGWMEGRMDETYALVVPGHGPPDANWPDGAAPQYRYLLALREDTRKAVAEGLFIEDAKDVVAVEQRAEWTLTERAHPLNVSRAFRELEWE